MTTPLCPCSPVRRGHGLGRRRLRDTMLAATYYGCGITTIVTSNARGYRTFGVFELIKI